MRTLDLLWLCFQHFAHLDRSNAPIHAAAVRYSPLTFRLAEKLSDLDIASEPPLTFDDRLLGAVLADAGKYTEDKGR